MDSTRHPISQSDEELWGQLKEGHKQSLRTLFLLMTKETDRKIIRLTTDSTFRKWCLGRASQKEKEYWQAWIAESIDHQQEAITVKRIVVELEKQQPFVSEDKKYRDWQKLSRKIHMTQHSSDAHKGGNLTRSSLGWITTTADSILLLVASFLTLEYTDLIKITNTRNVQLVMKSGKIYNPQNLIEEVEGKIGPEDEAETETWFKYPEMVEEAEKIEN